MNWSNEPVNSIAHLSTQTESLRAVPAIGDDVFTYLFLVHSVSAQTFEERTLHLIHKVHDLLDLLLDCLADLLQAEPICLKHKHGSRQTRDARRHHHCKGNNKWERFKKLKTEQKVENAEHVEALETKVEAEYTRDGENELTRAFTKPSTNQGRRGVR